MPRAAGIYKGAMTSEVHLRIWMDRLLRLGERVGEEGEIPVAAVMLDDQGRCLGWGSNRRHHDQDPLGHAELVALRQAAAMRGDWRFNACTLVVTLEPCPMCAGALVQARVGTVVFGASDPKRGALGGCLNLARDPSQQQPGTDGNPPVDAHGQLMPVEQSGEVPSLLLPIFRHDTETNILGDHHPPLAHGQFE